jgi:hypothetical protein
MMYVIPVLSVITIYNTTLGTGKYGVCLSLGRAIMRRLGTLLPVNLRDSLSRDSLKSILSI